VPFSYNNKKKSTKRRVICLVSLLDSRQIQIGRRSETHTQAVIITTGWAMDHHHLEKKRERKETLWGRCAQRISKLETKAENSRNGKRRRRGARARRLFLILYIVFNIITLHRES
jgi:hypothetical protein